MDDAAEIELNEGFRHLARHRDLLANASDPQLRASLEALIRETEAKLAQLRREVYSSLLPKNT